MKKQLFLLMLTGFILIALNSYGQNNNLPTKKVKGIEYYIYTVQESEGLLAIGRKFNVSADYISKANPYIKNGLKVGEQILVPVQKNSKLKPQIGNKSEAEFIQCKVEKKQTLFAISHKYKVSQEDIIKYNPDVVNGLHEGALLKIPVASKEKKEKDNEKHNPSKTKSENIDENNSQNFIIHKVKLKETLFSISKSYNVDIKDIIKYNPGSETKISEGTELRIPKKTGISNSKEQKKEKNSFAVNNANETKNLYENKVIRIAYLLPFMLNEAKKDPGLDRFQNFYAGSLLAIQQAKEKGISLEIFTYDTENSEDKVTEILNNPDLKTMDLIIGPAFSNQVPLVSSFSKEFKINTLIPFTAKVNDLDSSPYLFQFNPGADTELAYLSELISGKFKNMHIVFANIPDISPLDEGKIRIEELQSKLIKERKSFSKIDLTTPENVDFTRALKKGEKNLIIFNTDKYSNVSPFISTLRSNYSLFDITLFEQYNWRNQSIKLPKNIYISPFISEFNSLLINDFNEQFNQYFGKDVTADTPRYDVLGYDLSKYFITLIHRYGSKFGTKVGSISNFTGIQSKPLFERFSPQSGFINQQVYLGEDNSQ
ncbi:MAG: LysM peptidoglycan-binding domain-containing protein [Paludibacter sp.]|nr:LysM peptidoglycan-binding domain-containing protein [Paludibacter sp.]